MTAEERKGSFHHKKVDRRATSPRSVHFILAIVIFTRPVHILRQASTNGASSTPCRPAAPLRLRAFRAATW